MAFKTASDVRSDRASLEQEEAAEAIRRDGALRKRVVVTLDRAPEVRRTATGDLMVGFTGREDGGSKSLSSVYVATPAERLIGSEENAALHERLDAMGKGSRASFGGSWAKRQWQNPEGQARETWEFKAQRFAEGDVSLEALRAKVGPQVGEGRAAAAVAVAPEHAGRSPALPTLSYVSGNVAADRSDVIVNTVNCRLSPSGRGVMGKGVAKDFAERFPSILPDYEKAIRSGELKPGKTLLFDLPDGRKWAALASKDAWQDKSQIEWVDSALKELGEKMRDAGLKSVGLPPPGCGNGGLDWKNVEPLVHKHLVGLDVAMFARPSGAVEPAVQVAPRSAAIDAPARTVSAAGPTDDKAKALRAFGGTPAVAEAEVPTRRQWTEAQLLEVIPKILATTTEYKAYSGIGSRETPADVLADMTAVARVMEARGLTGRSGTANGADTAFEKGAMEQGNRFEAILPWKSFDKRPVSMIERKAPPLMMEKSVEVRARVIAEKHHEAWNKVRADGTPVLSDGAKALHTRNIPQVLGMKLDSPVEAVLGYTVDGKMSGGTGQAMRLADAHGIPILNFHNPRIRSAILSELGLEPQRNLERDLAAADHARAERDGLAASPRSIEAPARAVERPAVASAAEFDLTVPPVRTRLKSEVESFCKTREKNGILSNMANGYGYEDGGLRWNSSEAQYQAARFPHNPDLQERIRAETNAFSAKIVAHEHVKETRPDWKDVNMQMMAYVITRRLQVPAFAEALKATAGKPIVELSVKDPHWGAQPRGDQLVGRDALGHLLTQLRDGARMDELPTGTVFPGPDKTRASDLGKPVLQASMYFAYDGKQREGLESSNTFDAIERGERTSTTRFPKWGGIERWEALKAGDVVRFFEDREMQGRSVDVVVGQVRPIDLAKMPPAELAEWSRAEGWNESAGRDFGRRYGPGVQITYALPDAADGGRGGAMARPPVQADMFRDPPGGRTQSPAPSPAPPAPSQAVRAAMSDKQKAMAAFGI